jgi:hypothetical protein
MIEKVTEAANNAIDALRGSPVVLALVLMQLLIIGALLYSSIDRQKAATSKFNAMSQLLSQCMKQQDHS